MDWSRMTDLSPQEAAVKIAETSARVRVLGLGASRKEAFLPEPLMEMGRKVLANPHVASGVDAMRNMDPTTRNAILGGLGTGAVGGLAGYMTAPDDEQNPGRKWRRALAGGLSGAALGGGVGMAASQVPWSELLSKVKDVTDKTPDDTVFQHDGQAYRLKPTDDPTARGLVDSASRTNTDALGSAAYESVTNPIHMGLQGSMFGVNRMRDVLHHTKTPYQQYPAEFLQKSIKDTAGALPETGDILKGPFRGHSVADFQQLQGNMADRPKLREMMASKKPGYLGGAGAGFIDPKTLQNAAADAAAGDGGLAYAKGLRADGRAGRILRQGLAHGALAGGDIGWRFLRNLADRRRAMGQLTNSQFVEPLAR